jgi:hypothetical protein
MMLDKRNDGFCFSHLYGVNSGESLCLRSV